MIAGLEARLATLAASGQTTTYGQLARDLGCRVADLTSALEALMAADTAQGLPLRAALLNARGTTYPARGFFEKAAALGHDTTTPATLTQFHRTALTSSVQKYPAGGVGDAKSPTLPFLPKTP